MDTDDDNLEHTGTGNKFGVVNKGPPQSGPVSFTGPANRLFRQIAAIIEGVLTVNWITFIRRLGYKEDDISTSHTEPTTKIFRILQVDAAQYNGDVEQWWQQFLKKLKRVSNRDLTAKVKDVYSKWDKSISGSDFSNIYPPLHSDLYQSEQVLQEREIALDRPELSMEINVVAEALDRVSHNPATAEITKWLRDGVPRILRLEREVKSLKTTGGISHNEIHELKRQIDELQNEKEELEEKLNRLNMENHELKRTKEDEQLREFDFVTRKEAQDIKDEEKVRQLEKQRSAPEVDITEALKDENTKLKIEVASLKKQIDEIVKVNHSWDDHYKKMKNQLEKQAIDLRKELDDLLAIRNENDQLKTETARHQQEMDITQKEKDTLLLQAKERIERLEKQKAEKRREVDALRQKFEKVQGYARTLTNQRKEAEDEISRLNEALAQQMRVSTAEVQKVAAPQIQSQIVKPPEPLYESIPSGGVEHLMGDISLQAPPQKRVDSMSEAELREELELLRQQTEVYRSDFQHERQDRQRVMGELDEMKKELKKTQREFKGSRSQGVGSKQRQMLEDQQYAQELQRAEEEALQRPAYRPQPQAAQPRYQPRQQQYYPQQRAKQNYYTVEEIQNLQIPNKVLLPHGGQPGYGQPGYGYYAPPAPAYGRPRNYAANDMVIDGNQGGGRPRGRLEVDGEGGEVDEIDGGAPAGQDNDDKNEANTCPRCKRSFSQDSELTVHLDRCLTD